MGYGDGNGYGDGYGNGYDLHEVAMVSSQTSGGEGA